MEFKEPEKFSQSAEIKKPETVGKDRDIGNLDFLNRIIPEYEKIVLSEKTNLNTAQLMEIEKRLKTARGMRDKLNKKLLQD